MRFVIFVHDHEPAHVHISGRGEARIALDETCSILTNKGLSRADIARARIAVMERREELLAVWATIHG